MVFLKKILITTDFSEYSGAAMDYALSFGSLYGSRLYVLHVIDGREAHLRTEEQTRHMFAEFVHNRTHEGARWNLVLRSGVPHAEIIRFAEEEGIDLIVIASHGRTGLQHVLLGSVAERVVRMSSIPVLAVKPQPIRGNLLQNEDVETDLHLR